MNGAELAFVKGAFDNRGDAVAAVGDNLRVEYWNDQMVALTEIPREQAIGAATFELFPRARGSAAEDAFHAALSGESLVLKPPFFAAADASRARDCDWWLTPLLRSGSVSGAVVVARSRVGAADRRERLPDNEQRFRHMADSSPVLLWMAGRDSFCNFFNKTWLEFSGRTLEEELGVGWAEGVHPEDFERCMNTYMKAFSQQQPFEMEYRLRRHDGEYRWLLDRGTPRFTLEGDFAGFVGSCVDISERRHAEQLSRDLSARLQRANRKLERLLYAASHELKEPVRTVLSHLQAMEEFSGERIDGAAREFMEYAMGGAQRMRRAVDGLVELSRVRTQPRRSDTVCLAEVADAATRELSDVIAETNADIEICALPTVVADRAQLGHLMFNLLDNALKFRGEDQPRIVVSAERSVEGWTVCVADNGIGIEAAYVDASFELFKTLHPCGQFPGAGVGLALCREIVDGHGGHIYASPQAVGTRIYFTIPAMTAESA